MCFFVCSAVSLHLLRRYLIIERTIFNEILSDQTPSMDLADFVYSVVIPEMKGGRITRRVEYGIRRADCRETAVGLIQFSNLNFAHVSYMGVRVLNINSLLSLFLGAEHQSRSWWIVEFYSYDETSRYRTIQ